MLHDSLRTRLMFFVVDERGHMHRTDTRVVRMVVRQRSVVRCEE